MSVTPISNDVFERIDKNDVALVVVDHQLGLLQLVRDYEPAEFRLNVIAHASLGKLFNIPVVLTTSAESGPNGPLPHEILEMYPDVQIIKRQGEVNAMDDPKFREAIRATGKKQIIIAGIVTEVCTAFCAMSLREAGYTVYANVDASGSHSRRAADDANRRMRSAGIHIYSMFAILCDLMRNWKNNPGSLEVMPWIDQYFPVYGCLARSHVAAVNNGVVQPGQGHFRSRL